VAALALALGVGIVGVATRPPSARPRAVPTATLAADTGGTSGPARALNRDVLLAEGPESVRADVRS